MESDKRLVIWNSSAIFPEHRNVTNGICHVFGVKPQFHRIKILREKSWEDKIFLLIKNTVSVTKYTLEYDRQADALYIKISTVKIDESSEAGKDIILDIDKNKHLVGIEILNFSKNKLDLNTLIAQQFGNLVSLVK